MTAEEMDAAVEKLIDESNEQSLQARRDFEEDTLQAKYKAMRQKTFRSSVLQNVLERIRETYEELVQKIQRELDESLQALYAEGETGGEPGVDPSDAPYEVDYTLPMRDRYIIVKNYYLAYEDKEQMLADFEEDDVAVDYLGSYYQSLYQLMLLMQI